MHNYNVVAQFYPWLKINLPLFWGMVWYMYDNEFETKENKIKTEDKIEPQQQYCCFIPTLLRYELQGYALKLILNLDNWSVNSLSPLCTCIERSKAHSQQHSNNNQSQQRCDIWQSHHH